MRREALHWLGYTLFALAALAVGMTITFPAEAVGQRLSYEVRRATGGVWSLAYREVAPWRLSGLRLVDVRLSKTLAAGEPLVLPFDVVRVRVPLLPLLLLRVGVSGDLASAGGRLQVAVGRGRERSVHAHLEAQALDLAKPGWTALLFEMPVAGRLDGTAEVAWESELRRSVGSLALHGRGLHVGPGAAAGVVLPQVDIGEASGRVELKDGRLSLSDFRQEGGNLRLKSSLAMQLKQPWALSQLNACLMLRAEPAFLADNPKIRSALQLAEMQLKRDGEGFLHLPLAGSIGAPKVAGGLCR